MDIQMKKFLICVLIVLGFSLLAEAKSLTHSLETEAAKLIGSVSKAPDSKASGGYVVCLAKNTILQYLVMYTMLGY